MVNRLQTRWRGNLEIPEHCSPLVRRFFQIVNEQQTTLTEVEAKAGVKRRTFGEWRNRRSPKVDNLQAALNAVGHELIIRRCK